MGKYKKRKEFPMLITRKCKECQRHMEFLEGTRMWLCRGCGYYEQQLSTDDDGLDACRIAGNAVDKKRPNAFHAYFDDPLDRDAPWCAATTPTTKAMSTYVYHTPKSCGHNQQRIKVGNYEIWATESYRVGWSGKRDVKPDYGVYLSLLWMDKFPEVFMNDPACGCLGMKHPYPALFVDWMDKKDISLDIYGKLVHFVIDKLSHGHTVEVGCQGAHGRTGTLIAGVLGKLESLNTKDAISELRTRYCKKAVESDKQVQLIRKYLIREGCDVK